MSETGRDCLVAMNREIAPQPGVFSEKPTLSVCMIVRDEEGVLGRCLKSVKDIADELIVVDTGSRDNTISVAEDFDAKVFRFKWCDDFAAARNEALSRATGDWILQVDADEELLPDSLRPLTKAMYNRSCLMYLIGLDQGPGHLRRFNWVPRLFRNHPLLTYDRPYHETVDQSVHKLMSEQPGWEYAREPNIMIRHYDCKASKLSDKHEQGCHIMESYLKTHPGDGYMLGQLGILYAQLGLDEKAKSCLDRALRIDPATPDTNYMMGLLLQKQGKGDAAARFYRNATAGDPLLAEAHLNLGVIYVDEGMPDRAVSELKKALAIDPELAEAFNGLGLAYINKGMYSEGIAVLKKAIAMDAHLASAHMNLGMVYTKQGMVDKAIFEYKRALDIDADYAKAHHNLAVSYYLNREYQSAIRHCDKAVELGFEVPARFLERLEPHR